jgi:glycosyltransferase involved in cell wall biosynthesis
MAVSDNTLDGVSVALVHEWLSSRAGSEKVFEEMAAVLPSADLFALTQDPTVDFKIDRIVRTTVLQRSQYLRDHREYSLPLMPLAWKLLGPRRYDITVSSSHAFSRCFPTNGGIHLSYVHTPLRYAWLPDLDGRGSAKWAGPARAVLRAIDRRNVPRVESFAANSTVVRERIQKFYNRDSIVIHPPVDVEYFRSTDGVSRRDFVFCVSRWIPYKRLDLVIDAAEKVGLPVVLAGDGPLEGDLRRRANSSSVPVSIVRRPTDAQLRRLYQAAGVVVFPANEDFGIVPVEAQAAGAPVVALRSGGSLDTVLDRVSGVLVDHQDVDSFASGIEMALGLDLAGANEHIRKFSVDMFRSRILEWVSMYAS